MIFYKNESQFEPDHFIWYTFHFGRDQIIMVKSKSILSDQNCFGHIEGQGISLLHILLIIVYVVD